MGLIFSAPRILTRDDSVEGFHCGSDLIDSWVGKRAVSARDAGTAVVYATFCEGRLAGFYTLSAQSLSRESAGGWIARNAPDQIPVILLGMLGVDVTWQGAGLGRDLLLDAVRRSLGVAEQIGARALVVQPLDDAARAFYSRHGLRDVPGTELMFAKLV